MNYLLSGDITNQITNGFNEIYALFKAIANPICVVALAAMGIYLLIGSDPQTIKKVKTWGISILVGMILINTADKIANWASKLGGS